jgi:hypothetical protein
MVFMKDYGPPPDGRTAPDPNNTDPAHNADHWSNVHAAILRNSKHFKLSHLCHHLWHHMLGFALKWVCAPPRSCKNAYCMLEITTLNLKA